MFQKLMAMYQERRKEYRKREWEQAVYMLRVEDEIRRKGGRFDLRVRFHVWCISESRFQDANIRDRQARRMRRKPPKSQEVIESTEARSDAKHH